MKIKNMLITGALLILAACGQTNEETTPAAEETALTPVEVQLEVPDKIEAGQQTDFYVLVTQGEEKVTDADEVTFEIWQQGAKESSQMHTAAHQGEGQYTISTSFPAEGSYFVQSHVTARDMHVMPKAAFTVGLTDKAEKETKKETTGEHESAHEHHHDTAVTIKLIKPDQAVAGQETALTIDLMENTTAFSGASVTLEITKEDIETPIWSDLTETETGSYTGSVVFPQPGEYKLVIHVKKGEFHTHQEAAIEVLNEAVSS